MKVKRESEVAQTCLTPSDPMDCSLPGSSVHGICQARVLEWQWHANAFREGNGNRHQYSCLENLMHKGAWWTTARGAIRELDMT